MKDSSHPIEGLAEHLAAVLDEIQRLLSSAAGGAAPRQAVNWQAKLTHLNRQVEGLARGIAQTDQQLRSMQALAEIGSVVNSSLDLETVLSEVMDSITRLSGAERAFLMLRDLNGEMRTVVARNWDRSSVHPEDYQISSSIVAGVLEDAEAVLTTNAVADPRFAGRESVLVHSLRSVLCVPLMVKGTLTGVIYADNKVRESVFGERERSLLTAFADQAAVALENARLFDSVRTTLEEVVALKTLMEDVFASVASGVITSNQDGIIQLSNHEAATILNMPADALVGSQMQSLIQSLSPQLWERIVAALNHDRKDPGVEVAAAIPGKGDRDLVFNISPLKSADGETRGVALVIDDLTEKRRLQLLHSMFERMVSPQVIAHLDPQRLQLGGQRAEITTLFADIRNFTVFSETTDPEDLVRVLNRYLALAADAILNQGGTIDKFLGDAVLAWFNAPVPQPDHTLRAVRAAIDLRQAVQTLQLSLQPRSRLSFGVGLHVGEALLGLVGTQRRLDYTAIGSSVNTARRLQEHAAPGQILISRQVYERLAGQVEVKPLPGMLIDGKQQALEIFEVLSLY